MFTYKLLNPIPPETVSKSILRSDGAFIPVDEANTDYQAYLAWVEQGGTPIPADEGVA
jgi:hypothetical protein